MSPDWHGLYAIIDPEHCGGRDPRWVADEVLAGGCAVLQLRDKRGQLEATRALALALRDGCRAAGVPFVLNDFAELAAELQVDGLHLGQDDMPLAQARAIVGAMPIGRSTHSLAQAAQAVAQGADLIGFGPVFATASKREPDPVVGLSLLGQVCASVAVPVVAIGGVSSATAAAVAASGARLWAAIGALGSAADPRQAARALHQSQRSPSSRPNSRDQ